MSGPGEELVEVVDRDGRVERIVTRAEMRAQRLRHRSTYVAVWRPDDRLVVHRRAEWKDVNPGIWDIAFGGVVGVGEEWTAAAERELEEEAGLVGTHLTLLGSGSYDGDDGRIEARVFQTYSDAQLSCPDGEVVETAEIPRSGLADWLTAHPVCPDSLEIVLPLLA